MRTQEEIQRAHDLLHVMIQDEVNIGQTPEIQQHAAISVLPLCWMLGCESGNLFANNLEAIADAMAASGLRVSVAPVPMTDSEFQKWRESR